MQEKSCTRKKIEKCERGSLALEQVLFIGAIVTMSLGLFAFYDKLADYFSNFDVSELPTSPSVPAGVSGNTTGGAANDNN